MNKEKILIGKTFKEAQEILRNCNYRIVSEDNKVIFLTTERLLNRYDIYLEKGIVIRVDIG